LTDDLLVEGIGGLLGDDLVSLALEAALGVACSGGRRRDGRRGGK